MKNILFIALGLWFIGLTAQAEMPLVDFGPPQPLQILRGDNIVSLSVEFANSPDKRSQGLMFRKEMADDSGMLFNFENKQVINMWMKNTLIPLDMIFLNSSGKIVTIVRNTKPESLRRISSGVPVSAVLEVNAGLSQKWQLQRGDQILHAMFNNKPQTTDAVPSISGGNNN